MSSNKYRITIIIESLLLAIALGLGLWWYVHNKVVREVEKSFEDGSAYTGEWLAGKMNGLGVLTLADGEVYEGSFVDGRKCGQGKVKKVIEVKGRQGIAIDENYYYVSSTTALYKYDKEGNLIAENTQPFQNPDLANHFGDIDICNGEIYCGLEKFEYGRGFNIAISVYDAETLQWKRDLPWKPESGQVEVSGICVDRDNGLVWMCDWVDSRYVYAYDLKTGEYHSKMQCRPMPYWTQGIFIADGKMLFAADDGEAMWNIPDNIYIADVSDVPYTGLVEGEEVVKDTPFSVKLDADGKPVKRRGKVAGGAKAGRLELLREMDDFKRAGEIEGLSIDPVNNDLVVLNNRGTQIVLGMSQGPIVEEGYDREIHELYVYTKIR